MTEGLTDLCKRLEHFETPEWAIRAILKREILTLDVVDPCTGTGIMGDLADKAGYQTLFLDVQDWGHKPTKIHDWLNDESEYVAGITKDATVFMNPPFSKAVQFVEKSFELGARKIVCFQRFAWWESKTRRDFWQKYPPNRVYICQDRATCYRHDLPQEVRDQMGNVPIPHAWFVWERGQPAGTLLGHIVKAEV